MTSEDFAGLLAGGGRIAGPVALIVAHPDDESLWAGAALPRLERLLLIHVTDGAPRDMADARRLGFASRKAYARARAAELDAALAALEVAPARLSYGFPDQEAVEHLAELADRLARDCADAVALLTHPYEGGHPDHDAAALAARLAAERIARRRGAPPALVEFACYHAAEGARRFGRFWPDPSRPERTRAIPEAKRPRLDAAIAAHATQAAVIDGWRPEVERWRAAPAYDFAAPPPPAACLYDGFGWAMTSERWRERAGAELALCP